MKNQRNIFTIFLLLNSLCTLNGQAEFSQKMIVNVPVADLRAQPQASTSDLQLPTSDLTNSLQITQLLLGEHILAHEEYIDENSTVWFNVSTLQQEYYHVPHGWHGFPGWMQANQLIAVNDYPPHNLVINNLLANIFDELGNTIYTLSIGTRLHGTQTTSNVWSVRLPDGKLAFINDSDVCFIQQQVHESNNALQKSIALTAIRFIGSFYSWGGRSAQNDQLGISSVDCSALIHLSFLAHGLQIPRMSHEQFLRSHKIELGSDLQPGDLIFFASIKKRSTRMDHVMLYLGDNQLLEATFADAHTVRLVSFQQRMGKPCSDMKSGDIVDEEFDQFYVYFSSFLRDSALLQSLRTDALNHQY